MKAIAAVVIGFLLAATLANSQGISYVSTALISGFPNDIVVDSAYAYIAVDGGLLIVSNTDSLSMSPVGGIALEDTARKIAIQGNFAYVANNSRGMQIIDISDPSACRLMGRFDTQAASAVAVDGDFAYVGDESGGRFYVVDISNPEQPSQAGLLNGHVNSSFVDIAVAGDYAFLADTLRGLYIIEISDPAHPTFVTSVQTTYAANALILRDTLVYILSNYFPHTSLSETSFEIYNISNPFQPYLLSNTIDLWCNQLDISLFGDYAFIVGMGEMDCFGIKIYDISEPTNPHLLDLPLIYFAMSCFIHDDYFYAAENRGTVCQFERFIIEPQLEFIAAGKVEIPYELQNIVVSGDIGICSGGSSGLYLLGLENPVMPQIRSIQTSYYGNSLFIANGLAYIGGGYVGLSIYDFSSGDSLHLLGYMAVSPIRSIFVNENEAFLARGSEGLFIADVNDPINPDTIYGSSSFGNVADVVVIDTFAFLACQMIDDFRVINVADPVHPLLVGTYNSPRAGNAIEVSGDYAFLAQATGYMTVLNISSPATPTLTSDFDLPGNSDDIFLWENFAFIACDTAGVVVLDISDPHSPVEIDRYNTPGTASRICVQPPFIYVADRTSLQILQFNSTGIDEPIDLPDNFSLSQNYPNPFNAQTIISYSLPNDFTGSLSIYDITGRLVRAMAIAPGSSHIAWDGLNNTGNPVSSGIYFYIIAGYPDTARKMALLR